MGFPDGALWSRLSPLLDRALELSAGEREVLIASLRDSQPELAVAVEGALAAHDRASASGFLTPASGSPARSLAGQVLGAYRLVERIGSGGMGSVWRAARVDGRFEGEVAVKLLHPSLIEGEGAERFRREGTILSRLTHPGIARLYDAGVSEAGQPYLVLELVEGERIDQHADARRLDVEARLILFLQVAEAVAQAHASLVVHRDLKPSNILVDRDGRVKLLDFGIATLLDAASGEASRRTQTVARALTPQYAAPEQLEGGTITTATDVYALGILLYELLTGAHPSGRSDTSPAELMRAITAAEPPRMSERVRRVVAEEDGLDRFAARATVRERLARRLAGDLDTIVAKALKKAAPERYPTVTALAEDVARHLADLPVRARPDRLAYRLRKLVVRRKFEVAAAALAIAALVASTAISWRQARISAAERDQALRDLERAEITNDFSAFLLSEEAPAGTSASTATLLSRGERAIERRFAGDAELRAHLLVTLSERYYENFQFDDWRRVLERANELAGSSGDLRLRGLAGCLAARALGEHGDLERSAALFAAAARDLAAVRGADLERARCAQAEAAAVFSLGDVHRAIDLAERALALERERQGPPGRVREVLNTLANAYSADARFAAADRAYAEVLALLEAHGHERTQSAAIIANNRAVSLQSAGQYLAAAAASERAVALARAIGGERGAPPSALWTMGSVLSLIGRHDEAVAAVEEAVAKTRDGGLPWQVFWAVATSTRVLDEAGQINAADARYEELERIVQRESEPAVATLAALERVRARGRWLRGDLPGAVLLARNAVERLEQADRPARELLPALIMLATAENANGEPESALEHAERAKRIALDRLDEYEHSFQLGQARLELAIARRSLGDPAATATLDAAIESFVASAGESSSETIRARELRARWLGATPPKSS